LATQTEIDAAVAFGGDGSFNWKVMRERIKRESTDIGGGMVQEWLKAPP
jgi:hypothetical protein